MCAQIVKIPFHDMPNVWLIHGSRVERWSVYTHRSMQGTPTGTNDIIGHSAQAKQINAGNLWQN